MWLNTHVGRPVEATLEVAAGGYTRTPLTARGVLRHWGGAASLETRAARDDLIGVYEVGNASIDASDVQTASLLADEDEDPHGVAIELAPGVRLLVVWGVDIADA